MKKRLISLFLAVLMVVSLFPAVQAASPEALWDYEQTADGRIPNGQYSERNASYGWDVPDGKNAGRYAAHGENA